MGINRLYILYNKQRLYRYPEDTRDAKLKKSGVCENPGIADYRGIEEEVYLNA